MKIGVVSLGLIGGSILKRLSKSGFEMFAVTLNPETVQKAKEYTENVSSDINILKDCDIVFVASPINKTPDMLDSLENIVSKDCIVADCASVKEFVTKKDRPYKFIGSHPMAGTEFSGFDSSFPELFEGAKWILTPDLNKVSNSDVEKLTFVIEKTGAEILIADAKEHDEAAALISHMPLLVAQALFHSASDNKLALKLASSGFRDMTRLACSNLVMAEDMRRFNSENIESALKKLNSSIDLLKNAETRETFEKIKTARSKMYSKDGKNMSEKIS